MAVEGQEEVLTVGRHFKRVVAYARPSDYAWGAATAAAGPGLMLTWEKFAPSYVGKGGFAPIMRLTGVIGLGAGFLTFYQRSIRAFPPLQPRNIPPFWIHLNFEF
jgi:hypothetical protein